jgi:hypothetical protein
MSQAGLPDFYWYNITKWGKYHKWPKSSPNFHKIKQMVTNNIKIFHWKALKNMWVLVWKYTIWQTWSRELHLVRCSQCSVVGQFRRWNVIAKFADQVGRRTIRMEKSVTIEKKNAYITCFLQKETHMMVNLMNVCHICLLWNAFSVFCYFGGGEKRGMTVPKAFFLSRQLSQTHLKI